MSVDPLADSPANISFSPYTYVWNNPINAIDPDGRHPILPYLLRAAKMAWDGCNIYIAAKLVESVAMSSKVHQVIVLSQEIIDWQNQTIESISLVQKIEKNIINDQEVKGTQTPIKALWKSKESKGRIDDENVNPFDPKRKGQIQYHDKNNRKYLYDSEKSTFKDFKTGEEMSKTQIKDLLKRDEILKGIEKAKKYFE